MAVGMGRRGWYEWPLEQWIDRADWIWGTRESKTLRPVSRIPHGGWPQGGWCSHAQQWRLQQGEHLAWEAHRARVHRWEACGHLQRELNEAAVPGAQCGVSTAFLGSPDSGICKAHVNSVNLVTVLFSVKLAESLLGGISALRVLTQRSGTWGPVATTGLTVVNLGTMDTLRLCNALL